MDVSPAELDLVRRAQKGELAAFEALTNSHAQRIFNVAFQILRNVHDAEDITQQTFVSALEHLRTFRGEASFSSWLVRIATHAALKVIRKRRGLEMLSLEEQTEAREDFEGIPHPEFIADWRQTPDELAHRGEIREMLDEALAQLDEKHRAVFLLRDIEGFSVKETAEALDLSEANTKIRLLRARLQLREELTRKLGDPAKRLEPGHSHAET